MGIYIEEHWINQSKGWGIGDSDVYETYFENIGDLYRNCVREHGRCAGKVYIDTPEGVKAVGWVFEKRDRYEATGEPYMRETWVTVHEQPDTVTRTHYYRYL